MEASRRAAGAAHTVRASVPRGAVLSEMLSATVLGVDGVPVRVEADVAFGLPSLTIVGLAGSAVQEARERVRSAIRNCGFEVPARRITVNLAPASLALGCMFRCNARTRGSLLSRSTRRTEIL